MYLLIYYLLSNYLRRTPAPCLGCWVAGLLGCFVVDCSGIKNNEYKTITAEDKAIAAITFFESIIFLL